MSLQMSRCLGADPDIFFFDGNRQIHRYGGNSEAPVDYEHMIGNLILYQGSPAIARCHCGVLGVVKLPQRADGRTAWTVGTHVYTMDRVDLTSGQLTEWNIVCTVLDVRCGRVCSKIQQGLIFWKKKPWAINNILRTNFIGESQKNCQINKLANLLRLVTSSIRVTHAQW